MVSFFFILSHALFKYIREQTDSIKRHNSAIYKLLNNPDNRIFWTEIPLLEDPFYHVDLWLKKYCVLKGEECMALIYVGVEDGRPFPSFIDKIIHEKFDELKKDI